MSLANISVIYTSDTGEFKSYILRTDYPSFGVIAYPFTAFVANVAGTSSIGLSITGAVGNGLRSGTTTIYMFGNEGGTITCKLS